VSLKAWTKLAALAALALLSACASGPGAPTGPRSDPAAERFAHALELMQQARHADAVAVLEPLAEQQPERAGVQTNLGISYMELGRSEDARRAFEAALERDPEQPVALNRLAILERRTGRFEQARALYERLLTADPEHPHGHLNLAILCDIYLQDLECAHDYYRRHQTLSQEEDEEVTAWLADLERRRSGGEQR
jgi:Flp pilus assembly protein TadD